MPIRQDLTNQRFTRLLVLRAIAGTSPIQWVCQCDCGKLTQARGSSLKYGNTRSCGCLAKQTTSENRTTHGGRSSKLYQIYTSMHTRCECATNRAYSHYGAQGISICADWGNFTTFQEWALNNGYQDGLSIDRIDPYGNYTPQNCRWATRTIQSRNRRAFRGGSSQFIGVSWNAQTSKWNATICVNYKAIQIGRFVDEVTAAKTRDAYIIQNGLEGFTLNFP